MRTSPALTLVVGTMALAIAVACSQASSPTSPAPAPAGSSDLGPGGATLKVPAPTLQSPTNGTQVTVTTNVPLVAGNVAGSHATFPVTLEYEVRNAAGAVVANPKIAQSAGSTTTYTLPIALQTSAVYSWRARGTYNGAFGPWSSTFTFKAPDIPPAYIRGSEIFDPLTDGKTVGTVNGNVQWLPGVGVKLLENTSHISYVLPTGLQTGQFSLMVRGVDESNPGDKSKIMSMAEGFGDVTTNDYRMTAELRGRFYITPGAVQARFITGDAREEFHRISDTPRRVVDFSDEVWYLWRVTWTSNTFTLEVRQNNESGPVMYAATVGTSGHAYRPVPHVVYIGQPPGRAGTIDATAAGMIVKNLWVSSTVQRPLFPFPSSLLSRPGQGGGQ